jgi:NADH-quinone oxidoreductase subunit N
MTTAALQLILPEMVLIAVAVAIYMGGAFSAARGAWRWMAGGAILLAAVVLWSQNVGWDKRGEVPPIVGSDGGGTGLRLSHPTDAAKPLFSDDLARFSRWLALGLGALLLLLMSRPQEENTSEQIGSLLLTIAGLMLVAVAGDLVLLFVSLELISIPTYVLLYIGRRSAASQESAAKYFFLSVFASVILLYGFSFLYGVAGSTELTAVRAAFDGVNPLPPGFSTFAKLATAMIFGGLCFKIAAVPFQFYAPDVYQGTTHPNAAFLSVVPKAAGFVVLVRIVVLAMPDAAPHSWQVVLAVAALTMTFGNVMALWQDNVRRLLAYSSIAQAGYMLIGLAVALAVGGGTTAWDGAAAIAFYLTTYAVATIGAFAILEHLGRPDRSLDGVDELAGLGATCPGAAAVLAVCTFSLAGIPPLAGFWGKFLIFGGALSVEPAGGVDGMRWWFVGAAILGMLNAAVAATYYLRIVAVMYFRTPLASPRAQGGTGAWWAGVACALLLLGVGVYPGALMREAERVGQRPSAMNRAGKPQAANGPLKNARFDLGGMSHACRGHVFPGFTCPRQAWDMPPRVFQQASNSPTLVPIQKRPPLQSAPWPGVAATTTEGS